MYSENTCKRECVCVWECRWVGVCLSVGKMTSRKMEDVSCDISGDDVMSRENQMAEVTAVS